MRTLHSLVLGVFFVLTITPVFCVSSREVTSRSGGASIIESGVTDPQENVYVANRAAINSARAQSNARGSSTARTTNNARRDSAAPKREVTGRTSQTRTTDAGGRATQSRTVRTANARTPAPKARNASTQVRSASNTRTARSATNVIAASHGATKSAVKSRTATAGKSRATSNTTTRARTTSATALINSDVAAMTEQCKVQYTQCMDNFCNVLDDAQGRCSCSKNIKNYAKTSTAQKEANAALQDIAQQIQYIGLSRDEVETLFKQTEAELTMQGSSDNSQIKNSLDKIKDMIIDVKPATAANTEADTGLSFNLDGLLDFNLDSMGFDLSAMFGGNNSNTSSISNQRGEQLYKTASARCKKTVLDTCQAQGINTTLIANTYDMEIDRACIAYERSLSDGNDDIVQTVRNAQSVLQRARLMVEQQKNLYDLRGCVGALDACMQDEFVCGSDYELCLDPTGKYIVEGAVVVGSTPGYIIETASNVSPSAVYDRSTLMGTWYYDDKYAWGATKQDGTLVDYIKKYVTNKPITDTSSIMAEYLQYKIGYNDNGKNYGMCMSVLNKCKKLTYNSKTGDYIPNNQVITEYLSRTLVRIKHAQDEILADYAEGCITDVSSCLSTNGFDTESNSKQNIAINACRAQIKTCMSVHGNSASDPDPIAMRNWVLSMVGASPDDYDPSGGTHKPNQSGSSVKDLYTQTNPSSPMAMKTELVDRSTGTKIAVYEDTQTDACYANPAQSNGSYSSAADAACVVDCDISSAGNTICNEDNTVILTASDASAMSTYARRKGVSLTFNGLDTASIKIALENGQLPSSLAWVRDLAKDTDYRFDGVVSADGTEYYNQIGNRVRSSIDAGSSLTAIYAYDAFKGACRESGGSWQDESCSCAATGTIYDEETAACVCDVANNFTGTPTMMGCQCATEYEYDSTSGTCIKPKNPEQTACEADTNGTWNGTTCECSDGYEWNGTACVSTGGTTPDLPEPDQPEIDQPEPDLPEPDQPSAEQTACEADTNGTWDGTTCECSDGYEWNGTACVSTGGTTPDQPEPEQYSFAHWCNAEGKETYHEPGTLSADGVCTFENTSYNGGDANPFKFIKHATWQIVDTDVAKNQCLINGGFVHQYLQDNSKLTICACPDTETTGGNALAERENGVCKCMPSFVRDTAHAPYDCICPSGMQKSATLLMMDKVIDHTDASLTIERLRRNYLGNANLQVNVHTGDFAAEVSAQTRLYDKNGSPITMPCSLYESINASSGGHAFWMCKPTCTPIDTFKRVCEATNGNWNATSNECSCDASAGLIWKDRMLPHCTCRTGSIYGGFKKDSFNPATGSCECDSDREKWVFSDGEAKCVPIGSYCDDKTKACRCDASKNFTESSRVDTEMNADGYYYFNYAGHMTEDPSYHFGCRCKVGYEMVQGPDGKMVCKSGNEPDVPTQPSPEQTACENQGGNWKSNKCDCGEGKKWSQNICMSQAQYNCVNTHGADSSGNGITGVWENGACTCPGVMVWYNDECIAPDDAECLRDGFALDSNGQCNKCPGTTDFVYYDTESKMCIAITDDAWWCERLGGTMKNGKCETWNKTYWRQGSNEDCRDSVADSIQHLNSIHTANLDIYNINLCECSINTNYYTSGRLGADGKCGCLETFVKDPKYNYANQQICTCEAGSVLLEESFGVTNVGNSHAEDIYVEYSGESVDAMAAYNNTAIDLPVVSSAPFYAKQLGRNVTLRDWFIKDKNGQVVTFTCNLLKWNGLDKRYHCNSVCMKTQELQNICQISGGQWNSADAECEQCQGQGRTPGSINDLFIHGGKKTLCTCNVTYMWEADPNKSNSCRCPTYVSGLTGTSGVQLQPMTAEDMYSGLDWDADETVVWDGVDKCVLPGTLIVHADPAAANNFHAPYYWACDTKHGFEEGTSPNHGDSITPSGSGDYWNLFNVFLSWRDMNSNNVQELAPACQCKKGLTQVYDAVKQKHICVIDESVYRNCGYDNYDFTTQVCKSQE